ncbi:uncharacterized protein [Setaria viridis]|uniref:uncharacterized protein n=1 Tax=Setaria viridis TaxID=4556 RepID=UPI00149352F5|nr:uncharacterized protein LOC117835720 [Setaria viridis]
MLARFMAIPNHTYLVMKMPAPKGVFPIFGDIETFYNCDIEVVQLVETLKYSINAIMMLTESKNIDQNQLKIPEIEPTPLALQPDQEVKKISLDLEDPSKTALIGARLFPK